MGINTSYPVPTRVRAVGSFTQFEAPAAAPAPVAAQPSIPAQSTLRPVLNYPPQVPQTPYTPYQPYTPAPLPSVPTLPPSIPSGGASFGSQLLSGLKDGAVSDVNFVLHPIQSVKHLFSGSSDPTTFMGALRAGQTGRALGHAVSAVAGVGLAVLGGRFLLGKLGAGAGGANVGTASSGFFGTISHAIGSVFRGIGSVIGGIFHGIGSIFHGGASVGYR